MTRPRFNPITGLQIKYANSPTYQADGTPLNYGEDRSDATRWNQEDGTPLATPVTVNVANAAAPATPMAGAAPATNKTVTVQRLKDNAYDNYPTQFTTPGRAVRDIRREFQGVLSLRDTMVAIVDGDVVGEGHTVNANSVVTFREGAKERGQG